MSAADSSWLMPPELRFCLILGIPSWLMPLRDRSGQRWQPSGKPYVVAATEVCSRFIGTCRDLGCTYSVYIQTRLVFLGRFNEVRIHRFSSPPFGSPFIPSPSHTFVSSFLSCPPVFMSGHLILFFVCAHIGPGLSVYVHFYRFQVAQVFTMKWASSVVPVHLVPLSFQPHAPLPRLVLLSCLHFLVSCTRTRAHSPTP